MENVTKTSQQSRCYTVEDIMKIMGVGRKAVYALIRRKEFRAIQIKGAGYRIPRESFDEWLLEHA